VDCGTNTAFSTAVDHSAQANAVITFTHAGGSNTANAACTITTALATSRTGPAAVAANTGFTLQFADGAAGNPDNVAATPIPTSSAISLATFSDTELSFANTWIVGNTAQALTLKFKCTASISKEATGDLSAQTLKVAMPNWILDVSTSTVTQTGCGTGVVFTASQSGTGEANAKLIFTVATASVVKDTLCTLVTAASVAKTPLTTTTLDANLATYTIQRGAPAAVAILKSTALTSVLGNTQLKMSYPVIGTAQAATFTFTPAVEIAAAATITLTLPYFTFVQGAVTGSTGCTMATADATLSGTNSGATSALVMAVGGTALAASTACTITIPATMLKQVATATDSASVAQGQNLATRLVALSDVANTAAASSTPIAHSTPTVASAAFAANSALVVATTTGSTATSLALTFDSNIPLAIGDYVMLTLPNWGVSGTAAPTAVGCGTSTFTTVTGMSGTATAYVQFSVASALLDTVTYVGNDYLLGHNCTLTWASGAKTPATAQAANLNTRKIAAIIAAGADIANTTIATSTATTAATTPTPAPTSGGNETVTCTYSSASTCATRVTQSVVVSSLTAANYIGNLKSIYECGYAQAVRSDFCTSTSGATTIKTGVQVTSTAAARRAATITFVMDVETGVMATAALQTAIQDGVTPTALVGLMVSLRTSTGWSAVTLPAVADLTVNTAAFTGAATSSAAVVIPSALMVLLGSFISLFWN